MSGARALQYAEQTLGVHTVHKEAGEWAERLDKARARLMDLRGQQRDEEANYTDLELNTIAEARAQLSDMSQAAFDRHIKIALNNDETLREERAKLAARARQIDSAEYEVSVARTRVEILLARMHELGGYFGYLAAIKNAETAEKYRAQEWPSPQA
jgi:DNA-binding transcriptional ArsR family regulator